MATPQVDRAAGHDAQGPGRERRRVVEPAQPAKDAGPSILGGVAGQIAVVEQAIGLANEALVPDVDQTRVRLLLTGLGTQHQQFELARRRRHDTKVARTVVAVHEIFYARRSMTEPPAAPSFACRDGCGACCIAPSIETPFFGMPDGKRAGERCVHLDALQRCELFGRPERPQWCADLRPSPEMCGDGREQAMRILERLERDTRP